MRIAAATPLGYALPFTRDWPGAASPGATRRGWLLRLDADDGRCGFGECAPLPSHGSESHATAAQALRDWCASLPGRSVDGALTELSLPTTFAAPAVRAAVECALLDLAAQAAGVPLRRQLVPAAGDAVAVNALAGDAVSTTPAQIAALLAAGFSVIKLKLGVAEAERELAALRALAAALPPPIRLRLDANRAWDAATAARVCAALAELPVESLEEPLATPTPAALRALQGDLPFALAVDESWPQFDPEEFFAAPPVRRLVLKLAPHGGLRPVLATARRAQAAGIDCVVSSGVDSACAVFAAAQLAAAIDNGLAHGLATSSWLAADTGAVPVVVAGRMALPSSPGVGFIPATSFPSR